MQFVVITDYSSSVIEADDVEDAIHEKYDSHCNYDHIKAVIRIDVDED